MLDEGPIEYLNPNLLNYQQLSLLKVLFSLFGFAEVNHARVPGQIPSPIVLFHIW